ncbi:MAG: FKBP-type peptidyl-prolyl cis-trans isomerase [Dysgonamonadaceae bacterium]|jgi:FKBP-type peptidyl-prolyl cis-trans isomerase FklB|nr:FKBP-type peptidyl-prolyl cis-trans isomerase [Dysgonamonadaceae bacterium]
MKKLVNVSLFSLLVVIALFSCTAQVPKGDLKTAVDSVSYAQGVMYASQVEQLFMQLGLDSANKADFIRGFKEGFAVDAKNKKAIAAKVGQSMGLQFGTQFVPYFNGQLFGSDSTQTMSKKNFLAGYLASVVNDSTAAFTVQDAQTYSMSAVESIKKAALEKEFGAVKKENEEWLEKNKSNDEEVQVTASGLQYKVVTEGKGAKPAATDVVKVNYKGTNINGEVFDETTGEPRQFSLNGVIKGWTEGIQLMSVGSKYIFYVPADLAYGSQERSEQIKPFSTLIFEVELLDIVK